MSAETVPDYNQLARRLESERAAGMQIALTNGVFDLLHVGHVRLIRDAARECELLVIALNTDASVRENKGDTRPVVPLAERMEMIAAFVGVDYVTSFGERTAHELIETLRPDVYVKGTDWTADTVPERTAVAAYGGRIAICGDEKTHSSSEMIERSGHASS